MATGVIYSWFGDETDGSVPPTAVATSTSSVAAGTNSVAVRYRTRGFSPSTDNTLELHYTLPTNYVSGGTLNVSWISTNTTGNILFKTAFVTTPANTTNLTTLSFGSVTSTSAIAVATTAGMEKTTSIALGLTSAVAGARLIVMLGRDADNVSDTATATTSMLEPWSLSFTTT